MTEIIVVGVGFAFVVLGSALASWAFGLNPDRTILFVALWVAMQTSYRLRYGGGEK